MTNSATDNPSSAALVTVRRLLLVVFVVALLGTAGELLLVGHVEDVWQWVPLALIAASLLALAWHATAHATTSRRVFRTLMWLCMASGVAGVVLHYQGKVEFKLETNPSLAGFELFQAAMKGPAPPVLAPCMMIQIGLLGLAWSYCRPAGALTQAVSPFVSGERP